MPSKTLKLDSLIELLELGSLLETRLMACRQEHHARGFRVEQIKSSKTN